MDKEKLIEYIKDRIRGLKATIKNNEVGSHNYIRYNGKLNALEDLLITINSGAFENTTTIRYVGIDTQGNLTYQCDKCGGLDILYNADYCPSCGLKIE